MFHLIKKDIAIQKRNILLSFLYMVFFALVFGRFGPSGLPVGVMAVTYLLVLSAFSLEEKNNGDRMLISLPLKRSTIVLSKYLSVIAFALYAILSFSLISVLEPLVPFQILSVSPEGLVASVIIVVIFAALLFPLLFKYGYTKSRAPVLIIFILSVSGGPALLERLSSDNGWLAGLAAQLSGAPEALRWMVLLFLLAVVMCASYGLSLSIYARREF